MASRQRYLPKPRRDRNPGGASLRPGPICDTLAPAERRRSDAFDFGYVLTVHKSQGSQWDDVVLFDESFAFRENAARWLYTGITRAARRVCIVR